MLVDHGGGYKQLYTWGGSKCSDKDLSTGQEEGLLKYVGNRRYRVQLATKAGAGSTICVVAYTITHKKYLDQLPN